MSCSGRESPFKTWPKRYAISLLVVATGYFAIAFLSVPYTSQSVGDAIRLSYACVFAFAITYGYDRNSSPFMALGVIGPTLAYFVHLPREFFGLDRSVDPWWMARIYEHHVAMLTALLAFLLFARFAKRQRTCSGVPEFPRRPLKANYPLSLLLLLVAYSAFAFFTISQASILWALSLRSLFAFAFVIAILYGYDREHTPAVAFGVTGFMLICFVRLEPHAILSRFEYFGFGDFGDDSVPITRTFYHHFSVLAAFAAFIVWHRFAIRQKNTANS
jgi:hypothetical protein